MSIKKNILKYFLELLIVAFGVFLGIYVSEWRSQRKVDLHTEKSLSHIIEELDSNIKNLDNTIAYHQKIRKNLPKALSGLTEEMVTIPYFSNQEFRFQMIQGWDGAGLANLQNIAYESAKISGVMQELNIETVLLISDAYKKQEQAQELGKLAFDKMINMDSNTKTIDAIGIIELLTNDIMDNEQGLIASLKRTVEALKKV